MVPACRYRLASNTKHWALWERHSEFAGKAPSPPPRIRSFSPEKAGSMLVKSILLVLSRISDGISVLEGSTTKDGFKGLGSKS